VDEHGPPLARGRRGERLVQTLERVVALEERRSLGRDAGRGAHVPTIVVSRAGMSRAGMLGRS
jgi:hypothetical protein